MANYAPSIDPVRPNFPVSVYGVVQDSQRSDETCQQSDSQASHPLDYGGASPEMEYLTLML